MSRGSFEGLYTFREVGEIYDIDSSCLRKKVCFDKFVVGKDVKKFGKTWSYVNILDTKSQTFFIIHF